MWGRLVTCVPVGNRRKIVRVNNPRAGCHPASHFLDFPWISSYHGLLKLGINAEAQLRSETEAVISLKPDIDDLVPSEASPRHSIGDPAYASSFPKVLRRRLDNFFSDGNISPKADRAMWVKIAVGLAVLAGSWIALYALNPDSWKFVAFYLLGGLAQTFLLLNIAHDSNHNAISSVRSVNKVLNYVFDVCGINSYMWRILHHRGHHSCINLHGEDDALTGRRIFRFTPHEPARAGTGSSTSTRCSFTRCFLSTMFSSGTLSPFSSRPTDI